MDSSFNEEKIKILNIIKVLKSNPSSGPFIFAIESPILQDYIKIIKKPMHLTLVESKLKNEEYKNVLEIFEDLQLIWDNCKYYNQETSEIYKQADILERRMEDLIKESGFNLPAKSIYFLYREGFKSKL